MSDNTKSSKDVKSWPDLAGELYDKLTGRGSEISYVFDNFKVDVPDKVGPDAIHTRWGVSGTLKIHTTNK